jgi:tRNA G18 (ribose-2'-O)-methylase SpoU
MKFNKKKITPKINKFHNNNKFIKNKFSNNKIKAPSNQNFFLWGKHALEAAIINKKRKLIKIYHTNEMYNWLNEKLKNSNRNSEKLMKQKRRI